jgi:hypothetical protein
VTRGQGVGLTATLIMQNTCPNRDNHDRVYLCLPRSHRMGQVGGGLDS